MPKCIDVAEYLLMLEGEAGEMSNLKLQKLVYYAQGFSLALRNEALFEEPIEAWMHGPVVPSLYRNFRDYGANPIPPSPNFDPSVLSQAQRHLVEEVFSVYGQYSAWKLRQLTHQEDPWRNHYAEGEFSREIPQADLQHYFRDNLVN
ncbi:type II toxin-antitoxin system antitoxin SocA domain-containing protein [Pseudomonas sp. NPDC007930]|uniref:Panacea domain-containing protein n=1 Tax=Pseudomonas sp. NPDC007930 TaxID=3364417 RepID=UPI0036E777CA